MKKILILMAIASVLLSGCSTTKRLGKDDILYTGLKGVEIKTPDKQKFPADVRSSLTEAVSVKPNNALLGSASVRYPFPLGLWVYNNWPNPPKGLKHWIYENLLQNLSWWQMCVLKSECICLTRSWTIMAISPGHLLMSLFRNGIRKRPRYFTRLRPAGHI